MKTVEVLWNAAPAGLKPADGEVHGLSTPLDVLQNGSNRPR